MDIPSMDQMLQSSYKNSYTQQFVKVKYPCVGDYFPVLVVSPSIQVSACECVCFPCAVCIDPDVQPVTSEPPQTLG